MSELHPTVADALRDDLEADLDPARLAEAAAALTGFAAAVNAPSHRAMFEQDPLAVLQAFWDVLDLLPAARRTARPQFYRDTSTFLKAQQAA